ncbi:MAG TPA: protein translocase subunit SecD [Syntrophorhabdaceae bacterium]|nr:protein translocase subunit SecD [Syntrophorhabdaceae bacterium]
MFKSLKLRFILILVFLIVFAVFLLPNVYEPQGQMKKYLPSSKIRLGLDLKGGMDLLLELDMEKLMENMVDRKFNALKDAMIAEGIRFLALDKKEYSVLITVRQDQKEKLYNLIGNRFSELKAGTSKTEGDTIQLEFLLPEKELSTIKDNAVHQALETIRNRIDQFGVSEPVIVQQGANQIVVQLPGVKDPQRALELIGRTAQLEFKLVDEENMSRAAAGQVPEGDELLMERRKNRETGVATTSPILVKKQADLTGDLLTDARVQYGSGRGGLGSEIAVGIEFNQEGADRFDKITAANIDKRLAIVLDNVVYSAPVIRTRISGGKAQITGNFTVDEATDLANVLRNGALPAPVKVVHNLTIGPALGQDSIRMGMQAAILGAVLVVLFMIYYYKLSGIVADIALFLNLIYLLGVFNIFNFTLTLPGIAGIILTMGIGVDTNVIIFERIREELRLGKTVRAAIDAGYSRAWLTIIDAHVTTLITTVVLFTFGTGPIQGFALTLGIGIVINLFTAVFGSKLIFDWIVVKYKPRSLSI